MSVATKPADVPGAGVCVQLPTPTDKANSLTLFRYFFAFAIFVHHLFRIKGGDVFGFHSVVLIQVFFIMSGYLNMNSYARQADWHLFGWKRAWRILPAYVVTILFCFVLGMVFTTLPLSEFLSMPQTWKYLVCNLLFLNFLEPGLPGVFADHVYPVMDASLWTMKIEVMYYLTVPFVWWMMKRWGTTLVLSLIVLFSMGYGVLTRELYEATHVSLYNALNHQFIGEMALFYFPALLLCHRERLRRWQWPLTLLAAVLFVFSLLNFRWSYLSPVSLSIMLVSLGYALEPVVRASRWKNITYEFFLLHFPVLQAVTEISPTMPIGQLAIIAFVVSIVLAYGLNTLVTRFSYKR